MIIDLSHLIIDGLPVYPGDSETKLIQSNYYHTDEFNSHDLSICMHSGTHIDGPMHLSDSNKYLNEYPLETFVGEGCLLDVCGQTIIDYREEYEQLVKENQIVLLYTGHSERYGHPDYFTNYPVLSMAFAELLVRKHIKLIGMDTPSPDKVPFAIHKYLFAHDILIIENLTNLNQLVDVDAFEVMALPLNIKADSSIARVIART